MTETVYRLLNIGEQTQYGDEYLCSISNQWLAVSGISVISKGSFPHRRPLDTSDLDAARAEIDRLREESEFRRAKMIEWRDIAKQLESELATLRAEASKAIDLIDHESRRDTIEAREVLIRATAKPEPPPAPAFVVDREGVYRTSEGNNVVVTLEPKQGVYHWMGSDGYLRADNGRMYLYETHPLDLVTYLAPLPPPEAGALLNVKPGEKLPNEFWYFNRNDPRQWKFCNVPGQTAKGTNIYADYREPEKPEPQNAVESDLLEGMAWFVEKLKSGAPTIAAPQRDCRVIDVGAGEVGNG